MVGHNAGKIAALIQLDKDTRGAVDFECIKTTGHRLAHCVRSIGWDGVELIARHSGEAGAISRELNPEESKFSSQLQQAEIMACIYDAYIAAHTKNPKRYPRPWDKTSTSYGSGAIPVSDFDAWFYGENQEV